MFSRIRPRGALPLLCGIGLGVLASGSPREGAELEGHRFVRALRSSEAFEEHAADAHRKHHTAGDLKAHLTFSTLRRPGAIESPPLIFHRRRDELVLSLWHLGERMGGAAEGSVHPGILATMLDQTCGRAARMAGSLGFTARMEVGYPVAVTPPGEYVAEAWVEGVVGRKVWVRCEIRHLETGVKVCEGKALFLKPRPS